MKNLFSISSVQTAANGASLTFLGTIPSNVLVKFDPLQIASKDAPILVELFEAPTVTANGTPLSSIAVNRMSTETAQTLTFGAPTISSNGTLIFASIIAGSRQIGGSGSVGGAFHLKPNTSYLFKITNQSGVSSTVSANLVWEEVV